MLIFTFYIYWLQLKLLILQSILSAYAESWNPSKDQVMIQMKHNFQFKFFNIDAL